VLAGGHSYWICADLVYHFMERVVPIMCELEYGSEKHMGTRYTWRPFARGKHAKSRHSWIYVCLPRIVHQLAALFVCRTGWLISQSDSESMT